MYKQIFVLDLFHILWCLPVLDLRNVNKFNSIQFNSSPNMLTHTFLRRINFLNLYINTRQGSLAFNKLNHKLDIYFKIYNMLLAVL
jgi:hypothetical protein